MKGACVYTSTGGDDREATCRVIGSAWLLWEGHYPRWHHQSDLDWLDGSLSDGHRGGRRGQWEVGFAVWGHGQELRPHGEVDLRDEGLHDVVVRVIAVVDHVEVDALHRAGRVRALAGVDRQPGQQAADARLQVTSHLGCRGGNVEWVRKW